MRIEVKFSRVNDKVHMPTKRDEDAGFDIYANIEESIIINPHETKLIPTGLRTAFEKGFVMILKERGSTGTKGIGQRCGVVDSGYRGEIFVPVTNHNNKRLVIKTENDLFVYHDAIEYPASKAITQAVMLPVPYVDFVEITEEELMSIESLRGEGSVGSSGK